MVSTDVINDNNHGTIEERANNFSSIANSLMSVKDESIADAKVSLNGSDITLQDYIFFHVQTIPLITSRSVINRTSYFDVYEAFPEVFSRQPEKFNLSTESAKRVVSMFLLYTWKERPVLRDEYDQVMRIFHDISTKHFLSKVDLDVFFEHYVSENYPFLSEIMEQFTSMPELQGLPSLEAILPKAEEIKEIDRAHKEYSHTFKYVRAGLLNSAAAFFRGTSTLDGVRARQNDKSLVRYLIDQVNDKRIGSVDALRRQAKVVIPLLTNIGHEYRQHYISTYGDNAK